MRQGYEKGRGSGDHLAGFRDNVDLQFHFDRFEDAEA